MNIEPRVGVGEVRFGMTLEEVLAVLGEPEWSGYDSEGDAERRWPNLTVRWGRETETVAEIAVPVENRVTIAGHLLPLDSDPLTVLCELDPEPVRCLGFLIFREIGVAISGFHDGDEDQRALTVFAPGRWDDMSSHFEPFTSKGGGAG